MILHLIMLAKTYSQFVKESKSNYTIFCDMDGVLTDFPKRFRELEGNKDSLNPNEYESKYGQKSFWEIVDVGGVEYWSDMEWMSDGQKLWHWLMPYKPTILSAPSRNPSSREGKHKWILSNLGISQNFYTINPKKWKPGYRIILNSQKHLFVRNEFDILIDDTPGKIAKWEAAGGTGILHKDAKTTIKRLSEILSA